MSGGANPVPIRTFQRANDHAKCLTLQAEATWRSGYATVCKTVYTGSIPVVASNPLYAKIQVPRARPAALGGKADAGIGLPK